MMKSSGNHEIMQIKLLEIMHMKLQTTYTVFYVAVFYSAIYSEYGIVAEACI